jgi:hypothetical protein
MLDRVQSIVHLSESFVVDRVIPPVVMDCHGIAALQFSVILTIKYDINTIVYVSIVKFSITSIHYSFVILVTHQIIPLFVC